MAELTVSTKAFSQHIRAIITESERIFLTLGKTTPLFVKELHQNLINLEQTYATQGGAQRSLQDLEHLFNGTKTIIQQSSLLFMQMHGRGDRLLYSLSDSLNKLQNLDEIIKKIRNDSEDMALIALNALTGAIKSGSAGRAFSVITDELKRLSDQTNQLTDILQTDSASLINQLKNYTNELHKLKYLQTKVFSGLDRTITEQFSAIEEKVRELTESLYALITESKTLETPVSAVMETVQIQDILRQSLDHILIALDEYESVQQDPSVDTEELAAFKGQLATLGEVIVTDVIKRLEAAALTFETAILAIQTLIRRGEKQRTLLLREHFSSLSEHSILSVFDEAARTLTAVEQNLSEYMAIKQTIASQGNRIADAVAILSKQYVKFDKIINRFKTVDIAARIEISKQSILRSIKNTVLAMSELISRITQDVEEARKASLLFITDTHTAISEYTMTYTEEVSAFSVAQRELLSKFQQFSACKENLEQDTRHFTLFSETFLSLLDTQDTELANIKELVHQCKVLRDSFSEITTSLPTSEGTVEIKNQHLKDIINKFTIYAHKQAAAEIGNFEVVPSSSAGVLEIETSEVTFF
uniref:Methyl-accepting transducer domain-containing protein n=1 Tax=Gracilinema caldarium TaxID=215591 RepID=A0A7C3IKA1_9SPIR